MEDKLAAAVSVRAPWAAGLAVEAAAAIWVETVAASAVEEEEDLAGEVE